MTLSTMAAFAITAALMLTTSCTPAGEAPDADASASAAGQPNPEEAAVVAAVEQLFEAMRVGDSEMARAVLHPEARLGRAGEDGISFQPADGFIEMIGRPRDEVYDEPVWDWTVQIDGRLAQMWTRYAFYRGEEFSHCGWEGFQLYKSDTGWQITQLVDTSHRENCFYPPGREPVQDTDDGEPTQESEGT